LIAHPHRSWGLRATRIRRLLYGAMALRRISSARPALRKYEVCEAIQHDGVNQPWLQKISLPFFGIMCLSPAIPPRCEGRCASSRNARRDAMDANARVTNEAACGRRNRMVLAPLGWR
jgi:hypothetical protein